MACVITLDLLKAPLLTLLATYHVHQDWAAAQKRTGRRIRCAEAKSNLVTCNHRPFRRNLSYKGFHISR